MSIPRKRRLLFTAIVLVVVIAAVLAVPSVLSFFSSITAVSQQERCVAKVEEQRYELSLDKSEFASLIATIGMKRGMPPRAVSIAIATAIQESGLRNLDYGDEAGPDSRGLFQQRFTQGWGTEEQLMDPVYATNAFYDALEKVPDYQNLEITEAAQAVQISRYPLAYAKREPESRAFASSLTGQSAGTFSCYVKSPEAAGDPQALATQITESFGIDDISVEENQLRVSASGAPGLALWYWSMANARTFSIEQVEYGRAQFSMEELEFISPDENANEILITLKADG